MTLQECYTMLNGNYQDAKGRMMTDRLVDKFILKFPQDGTMQQLREALAAKDYELAFRSAHTLKGVAANLSFTGLQASASALTELLRYDKTEPDQAAVQKVEEDYGRVISVLARYAAEKQ